MNTPPFPGFPPGRRHVLAHRITAAELAPIAALLGTSDPALSSRSAATLMTRLLVTRFPGRQAQLRPLLDEFGPEAVRAWAQQLGVATFVGLIFIGAQNEFLASRRRQSRSTERGNGHPHRVERVQRELLNHGIASGGRSALALV
jgi:hypothetical protein